jgi:multidrug efflux pump subunit AcrA (membrane-fusion protein)
MSTNSVPTDPLAALDALVATSAHQKARQAKFAEWVHCRQQDRAQLREAFDAVRHYQCVGGGEAFALGWAVAIHQAAEQVRTNDLERELVTHNPGEEAEALQAAKQVLRAALQGGIEAATTAARKLASAPICEDIRFYFGVLGSNFVGLLERRDEEEAWRLYRDRMPQAVANTEETPAPNADELPEHTGEVVESAPPTGTGDTSGGNPLDPADALGGNLPDWIWKHFRQQQQKILVTLWGKVSVAEEELFAALEYRDRSTASDNLQRRVTATNSGLCEKREQIGEDWTIRETTCGRVLHFYLHRATN